MSLTDNEASAGGRRIRLRRSPFALLVTQHLNGFWLGQGLGVLLVGLGAGDLTMGVLVGAALASPALTVFLFGVSVTDTELIRGVVWRRRTIPLVDIVDLTVGETERFGPRGMDVNGMRVALVSGEHVMVWESMSCNRQRLLEWAAVIAEQAGQIEVRESYISERSYRPPSKYLVDFERSPRSAEDRG